MSHMNGSPTKKQEQQRGFTLLLAALVSSIVLALGISIFGLVQKQLILSSIGRDSQLAFYAADTAAECALYWDVRHRLFPTTTPKAVNLTCDTQTKTTASTNQSGTIVSTFQFQPNSFCVNVRVEKSHAPITGAVQTTVRADGFSTGCSSIANSPRVLQRSVELHY